MQKYTLRYDVNPLERLFIDKSIESLYSDTIDSYRLKLHNPKSLLNELIDVINDSINGVLTNTDYLTATSKELKKALEEGNDGLIFRNISKKHFLESLSKPTKSSFKILQQSSKLILKHNSDYIKTLLNHINAILDSHFIYLDRKGEIKSGEGDNFLAAQKRIIILIDYLYVELINKGFSKQYLYKTFQSLFIFCSKNTNFDKQLQIFYSLIQKQDEKYTVIFSINEQSFKFHELKKIDNSYILVNKAYKKRIKGIISSDANNFLNNAKSVNLIGIDFETKDHFKAVQFAIDKISKDLDIYHLGFNNKQYKINKQCLTIGTLDPSRSSTVPSNFQIDGYFQSNANVFNKLLTKVQNLEESNIDKDSFQKILSAIRYYRMGSESPELENKFLNYWIGLEFIFNSYNSVEKTVDRIRNYFPQCHSLIYIKRNLFDFHQTLERLNIAVHISDYNDDLQYLLSNATYDKISEVANYGLLKFRSEYYRKWFQEPNKIMEVINKHTNNLNWNLTRLYRIRNEIVHTAAIKNNITTHISHLKYYLSFMLNSILNFMSENNVDLDNDGKISIDDFFISQEIILGCLKNEKLAEWIKIENPNQIFQ